ncbi:hypothetical protein TNCT_301381, partial [Trichonephila clavata]
WFFFTRHLEYNNCKIISRNKSIRRQIKKTMFILQKFLQAQSFRCRSNRLFLEFYITIIVNLY